MYVTEPRRLPAPASLPSPPACHPQRLLALRSRPLRRKARNGNGDASVRFGQREPARRPGGERAWAEAPESGRGGLPSKQATAKDVSGNGNEPGQERRLPQSTASGSSQRASAARGATAAAGAPSEPAAQRIFNPFLGGPEHTHQLRRLGARWEPSARRPLSSTTLG